MGWWGVLRLGLVQSALGAIVVLTTSTLNRVMVVEMALPALLPGLLLGWHYVVQVARPRMGHGADQGRRCTPWILGGMATLAAGGWLARGFRCAPSLTVAALCAGLPAVVRRDGLAVQRRVDREAVVVGGDLDLAETRALEEAVQGRLLEAEPDVGVELARLGDVAVARQRFQHLRRHAPHAIRSRQHGAARFGLAFAQDVDEGLAVEGQRRRAADLGIVEGWRLGVDDQVEEYSFDLRRVKDDHGQGTSDSTRIRASRLNGTG